VTNRTHLLHLQRPRVVLVVVDPHSVELLHGLTGGIRDQLHLG
jgi:hypothetical protein